MYNPYDRPANDTTPPNVLSDREVNFWAALELHQRALWAAELGLKPRRAGLLDLPPVPAQGLARAA